MNRKKGMRLSDAGIAGLKPDKTEYIVRDRRVAGLGVRVRPSGHRSFVWHGHANGGAVRLTIGSAALITVEDARRECLALQDRSASARMEHPNEGSEAPLFREYALGEWKASAAVRWGASRHRSVDRMLAKQLLPAFGALRLDRIRRPLVEQWFDVHSRTAPEGANKALQLFRQIMNAAVATGLIAANPAQSIKRNPRPKLTRFLSAEEIGRLHRTLDRLVDERSSRQQQADIIRLLLLTGCRKGEILKFKWSEVDGDVLRLADTKTGPRTVWLSRASSAIVLRQPRTGSAYVFPSPANPARPRSDTPRLWDRARKEAGGRPHARSKAHGGKPGRGQRRRAVDRRSNARTL